MLHRFRARRASQIACAKNQFQEAIQRDHAVLMSCEENFAFRFIRTMLYRSHPASMQRGVTADRHETWGGMRWTRRCRVRMRSQGEVKLVSDRERRARR